MILFDKITNNTSETESLGFDFANTLTKGDFVAMYGTLGAGKTAFVRGMAKNIAPQATPHSPTYTVVNEYRGKNTTLCHFDVYRITDDDDLYSTGFYDYTDCIMAVEWSENIEYALPECYYKVTISKFSETADADKRHIVIERIEKQ